MGRPEEHHAAGRRRDSAVVAAHGVSRSTARRARNCCGPSRRCATRSRPSRSCAASCPAGQPSADHIFTGEDGPVTLDELFDGHDQLLIYHLMLHPEDTDACAACSMFVDGLRGVLHAPRAALRVRRRRAGPDRDDLRVGSAPRLGRRAAGVRAAGTAFVDELGVAGLAGRAVPGVQRARARRRPGSGTSSRTAADFPDGTWRGMDLLSPVWNALDLLAVGAWRVGSRQLLRA